MKAIIVGSNGHLGTALREEFSRRGAETVSLDLPDFDVTFRRFVLETIVPLRPDVILNASGLRHIDWLETHPNTARSVHVQGTANLREAAKRTEALLVQCSTAEVFGDAIPDSRENGFRETDVPAPASVYARTKLDAERAAAEWERHLIVRGSLLFGATTEHSGGSLVETVLNAVRHTRTFKVIGDMSISPGWTNHFAEAVFSLTEHSLSNGTTGLYHLAGPGTTTHHDLVATLSRLTGLRLEVEPISRKEYEFKAARAHWSGLDGAKYHALETTFPIPPWEDALAAYLESRTVGR